MNSTVSNREQNQGTPDNSPAAPTLRPWSTPHLQRLNDAAGDTEAKKPTIYGFLDEPRIS